MILPAIRTDFKLGDSSRYNEEYQKLVVDITAFDGEHDYKAFGDEISAWQELTLSSFQRRQLVGDHFFIHSSEQQLLEFIANEMLNRNENISSRR